MCQVKAEKFLWIYKSPLAKTVKFNLLKKCLVGQKLEEARKRKGVSLREVSESTKIRGDYLSAIESGNTMKSFTQVYLRGFVRLYAILDLDQDAMVAELDNDLGKSSSKLSKKSLGSIVAQDQNENSSKTFTQKVPHPRLSIPPQHQVKLLSLPVVLSLVGVVTTLYYCTPNLQYYSR